MVLNFTREHWWGSVWSLLHIYLRSNRHIGLTCIVSVKFSACLVLNVYECVSVSH